MSVVRSWLLHSLRRIERVLTPFQEVREVRALIQVTLAVSSEPPESHVRKKLSSDDLGVELPAPPKARPLMKKLKGKKHLRLVISNGEVDLNAPRPKRVPLDPVGDQARQASGARSLLLEIVRRAAFDWVLYRSSRRLDQKFLAEDAYTWLFLEEPGHPNWKIRKAEDKELTSFLSICEQLDVDPEKLRSHIRKLTPNRVMSSGRPPENSRPGEHTPDVEVHVEVTDTGGAYDFDSLLMPFDHE